MKELLSTRLETTIKEAQKKLTQCREEVFNPSPNPKSNPHPNPKPNPNPNPNCNIAGPRRRGGGSQGDCDGLASQRGPTRERGHSDPKGDPKETLTLTLTLTLGHREGGDSR